MAPGIFSRKFMVTEIYLSKFLTAGILFQPSTILFRQNFGLQEFFSKEFWLQELFSKLPEFFSLQFVSSGISFGKFSFTEIYFWKCGYRNFFHKYFRAQDFCDFFFFVKILAVEIFFSIFNSSISRYDFHSCNFPLKQMAPESFSSQFLALASYLYDFSAQNFSFNNFKPTNFLRPFTLSQLKQNLERRLCPWRRHWTNFFEKKVHKESHVTMWQR